MSYGERLVFTPLGRLTPAATTHALVQPAVDTGRRFEPDALRHLTNAINGYPYFVQLFGFQSGVATGRRAASAGLYRVRWHRLTPAQRDYLYAAPTIAADHGEEEVSTRAIADRLGRKSTDVSDRRSELIAAGALYATRQGYVASDLPGFFDYVIADSGHTNDSKLVDDLMMPDDVDPAGPTIER